MYSTGHLFQAVYQDGKPMGLTYRTNFFSSYANPLGIVQSESKIVLEMV